MFPNNLVKYLNQISELFVVDRELRNLDKIVAYSNILIGDTMIVSGIGLSLASTILTMYFTKNGNLGATIPFILGVPSGILGIGLGNSYFREYGYRKLNKTLDRRSYKLL